MPVCMWPCTSKKDDFIWTSHWRAIGSYGLFLSISILIWTPYPKTLDPPLSSGLWLALPHRAVSLHRDYTYFLTVTGTVALKTYMYIPVIWTLLDKIIFVLYLSIFIWKEKLDIFNQEKTHKHFFSPRTINLLSCSGLGVSHFPDPT